MKVRNDRRGSCGQALLSEHGFAQAEIAWKPFRPARLTTVARLQAILQRAGKT